MPSSKSKAKPKAPKSAVQPVAEWTFSAIGTSWWIGVYQPIAAPKLARIKQQIAERIEQFDQTYSRFRDDSWVTQIAQKAGSRPLPADAEPLFALYRKLYDLSGGLVTPLIGQVLSDAGYDARYSLAPGTLTPPPQWDDVLTIRAGRLTNSRPILLDFGAAGKGYLVDIVSAMLRAEGVERFCVDASGDLYCHGLQDPLRIGLENPNDAAQVIGVAAVGAGALCGSAGNRRAWGDYHHIMNPRTLRPAQNVRGAWATAQTTLLADGLTTALFFVSPAELHKHFDFAHCVVYSDNTVQCSANFPAELFT